MKEDADQYITNLDNVYFFTKNLLSGNELSVSLQSADPNLGLPKT
jgi:hypothetical protein